MFSPLQIVLTPGIAGLTPSDARLTHAPAFSPFSNHVTRFFYSHHSNFVTRLLIYSQLESRNSAFDILVTRCQCVFTHNLQPTTNNVFYRRSISCRTINPRFINRQPCKCRIIICRRLQASVFERRFIS